MVVEFVLALGLVALVVWSFVEVGGGGCCTLCQVFNCGCNYALSCALRQSFDNYIPYAEVKVVDGVVLVGGRAVPNCCSEVLSLL